MRIGVRWSGTVLAAKAKTVVESEVRLVLGPIAVLWPINFGSKPLGLSPWTIFTPLSNLLIANVLSSIRSRAQRDGLALVSGFSDPASRSPFLAHPAGKNPQGAASRAVLDVSGYRRSLGFPPWFLADRAMLCMALRGLDTQKALIRGSR